MAITVVDLLHTNGEPNQGGTAQLHGFASFDDMATIQTPPKFSDATATLATIATIGTAHVFKAGKAMSKLYGTESKGKNSFDAPGDDDSSGFVGKAELSHPGSKAVADGLALFFSTWSGAVFLKEADGTVRQYGTPDLPARIKVSYDNPGNTGYRGYKLTIQAYGIPVIYTPGLNFTPAAGA